MANRASKLAEVTDQVTGELRMSNVQLLNTVRKYAPNDYKDRIPVATQGNIQAVLRAMNAYMPNWDIFWNVFIGRIGRVNINDRLNFTNPLAKFKQPSLNYGRTIQEIQANLIKARVYDPNGTNVFGREGREPEIYQAFHQENRHNTYELNIPMEDVLRGSFIEGESIAALWNSLTALPVQSGNNDEYLLMRNLTEEYDELHGYYNIHVDDIMEEGISFEEQQHRGAILIQKISAQYTKFKFNSSKYSPYGREYGLTGSSPRVFLLISADVDSVLKTITTAYAFNAENQKILADEVIVLDELPIQGCQALMLDENWFQCADTLGPVMLQSPLNPQNMSYNYFYHVWQILSYSLFLGAVMFSTRADTVLTVGTSTVTGVKLVDGEGAEAKTVDAGGAVQLFATVEGANQPNQAVRFEIQAYDGRGASLTLPAETYIDNRGCLHVGNAPDGAKIVVRATSVQNPAFADDYTATVAGAKYLTSIGANNVSALKQGATVQVPVTFTPADATNRAYEVYSVDGALGFVNKTPTGFSVSAGSDTPTGAHQVVIAGSGGDPAKAPISKTITVTVTA